MPIQQVAALLHRWEEASGVVNRGRVVADGMRLLSGLSPEERRLVARALAEEGAPELAQRLEAVSGGRADAGHLHDAAAGLLTLDRERVAHLADVLSDPDERQRLAHDAATRGLELLDPASAPPPDPPSRLASGASPMPSPDDRLGYSTDALHAFANGEVPLDDPDLGDQLLDHPELTDVALGMPSIHEIGLSPPPPVDVAPADPPDDHAPGDPPDDHAPADPPDDDAPADHAGAHAAALPAIGASDRDDGDSASPTREPDRGLVERLRAARTAHQRFAALADHHLGDLDPAAALAVLDAVPEGWQRRRTVERLGNAGTLDGLSAAELLARFPRQSDATFVAAAAIAHEALSVDDLAGQLPGHVVRRLASRARR